MRTRLVWLAAFFLIGFTAFAPSLAQDEVENILVNGGFEDGIIDPSGTYGGPTTEVVETLDGAAVEEDPIEGKFCLNVVVAAAGANWWDLGLEHSGHVFEKGKKYTLSAFLKCKEGTLDINFKPEMGADPWTGYGEQIFTMTEEWAEYSITTPVFAEDVSPATITFHIGFASAEFWIDGVRFYEGDYVPPVLGDRGKASDPNPADGAILENTWVTFSWKPGKFAVSHDVYLGEDFDAVNEATPDSDLYRGNQAADFYVAGFPGFAYPEGLVPGTTYYWRIDEVNDADPNSPWKGDIWSFTIPPKTAYNPIPADGAEGFALAGLLKWTLGYGAKLHTVYFGDNFDDVGNAAGGIPQGAPVYKPASLSSEMVYYWRVDEFDGVATYKGDVWGFSTPDAVGSPQPANNATGVQMTAQLGWAPAANATSHALYFGTDKDAVRNATSASPEYMGNKAKGAESHDPGKLALGGTYYWRVDAVYPAKTVKGLLWSFTIADFIGVDDFESYNDIDPPDAASNRIFDVWIDGFGTATNGALVGNDLPPYAEQTVVHGGDQSMPYRYDNTSKTSEATMTLVYPRNWIEEGATKLSLWFRGSSANAADRMYVALNGTTVVYHDDAAATQKTGWTEWTIDLTSFTDQGMNLANVNTITIGIGTKNSPAAGGTGTMYFDDISLVVR